MTREELKATQEAYASRPFAVRWIDSHFGTTSRFYTFAEAFDYAQCMWARTRQEAAERRFVSSNLRESYLETPSGRVSLAYYLLADDVSSYQ
jgi:hypothetical protein